MIKSDTRSHATEKENNLPGIFSKETLEVLTQKLSDATDFSFMVIDYRGNSITDEIVCNRFCKNHRNLRECSECRLTAAYAAAKAAIKCCPLPFTCPLGLSSIAVPIIVNDQYMGALVGGRVRCPDGDPAEGSGESLSDYSGDEDYNQIPVFSKNKINSIGDLMFLMLKEMGDKETLRMKLSSVSENTAKLEDIRRWNSSLLEQVKAMELKHLRTHIHPQFLLDMFTTVANFAVLEDATRTEELVVDFASIIRYYLDESGELITLESEIAQIEKYLSVMRSKYENKFSYHIKVSEEVRKIRIPILTLFSLLGYVINYGVFPTSFKSILFLDAEEAGDQCVVTMQMENRNQTSLPLFHGQEMIMDEEMIKVRLNETARRLEYVYGDDYSLNLSKDIVTLRFPKTITNMEVIL